MSLTNQSTAHTPAAKLPTRRELRELERSTGKTHTVEDTGMIPRGSVTASVTPDEALSKSISEAKRFETKSLKEPKRSEASSTPSTSSAAKAVPASFRSGSLKASRPIALTRAKARTRNFVVSGLATAVVAATALGLTLGGSGLGAFQADLLSGATASEESSTVTSADILSDLPTQKVELNSFVPAVAAPETALSRDDQARPADFTGTVLEEVVVAPPAPVAEAESESASGGESSTSGGVSDTSGTTSGASGSNSQSRAAQTSVPSGISSSTGQGIVADAMQYVGVIYYSNGASPSAGFDCSGLVQWVYGLNGISMPRNVSAQAAMGTRVSDPQPGDLVVWNDHSHIGIYTGNGKMIDSPDWGRTVQHRAPWTSSVYYVRVG